MQHSRPGLGPGIATAVGPATLGASLWVGAWLRGEVGFDDTTAALDRSAPDAAAARLLPAVRPLGATTLWLLLPRAGRVLGWPAGLPDPPAPALLLGTGSAAVGLVRLSTTGWRVDPAPGAGLAPLRSSALTARSAARTLGVVLTESAAELERLALDRPPTGTAARRWAHAVRTAPPTGGPEVGTVLLRAALVRDAVDLARADDGAAVTAGEARARDDALRRLSDRLDDLIVDVVAGCNPEPA